jgi:inositol hexakisphosphate/diphosphoinositol-pentakisphosphate kinase
VGRYSSVTHAPAEWRLDKGQPCGGEKLLLMFDRWQKLHKSFYSEKKGTFDISKVCVGGFLQVVELVTG